MYDMEACIFTYRIGFVIHIASFDYSKKVRYLPKGNMSKRTHDVNDVYAVSELQYTVIS